MSAMTGFAHSGANSLEWVSSSLSTWRANSMMATCMPRQMPRNGSPGLARGADGLHHALDAADAESARHEQPVVAGEQLAWRRSLTVNRSLESQATSTPTSLAMPPWTSASWMLL